MANVNPRRSKPRTGSGIIRLAEEGPLRPIAVSSRFNIDRRTASRWLAQLAEDGELQPMRKSKRIVAYQMPVEKRR